MVKDNIPPLTVAWLKKRNACEGGVRRFREAAPRGSLAMDNAGAAALRRHCISSDLIWLLREILGDAGPDAIDIIVWAQTDCSNYEARLRRRAAACVAAWREYHR